jgi:hypothetical protein
MKRLALGVALGAVLGIAIGVHSFVYACDRTTRTETTEKVVEVPSITVDVAVPLSHMQFERVSIVCTQDMLCDSTRPTPTQTVRRTAKVAVTLGRALVTTVGAVVGSLVDAAFDATASLV